MNMTGFARSLALVLGLAVGSFALGQSEVQAQQNVLVFSHQKIMAQSAAMKDIRAQAQEAQKQLQDAFLTKKAELESIGQELTRQAQTMDQATQEQKRRDFEAQVQEAQRDTDNRQRDIRIAVGKAEQEVGVALKQILDQLVVERGASLVFAQGQIVYYDPSFDVTDLLIQRLDQIKPTATVKFQ